ncbi:MAG: glycosyl transferase [Patescibacteria group bacterium]|nr:MAG: glycosyl transferase [Patescibacteria group bacterium]
MKIEQLSIVILTNRSDTLFEKALKSAQFADSIFIIDNASTNNWKELKEKYHFTVTQYPETILDFSRVRNEALKKVKTPWVLFLDSDEILPDNADDEINTIIQQNLYDAVAINRVDYFLGKPLLYGETGNISLIRLFKTQKGSFVRNVHEVVDYSGHLGSANFIISHYSHNSIQAFLEKVTAYARLESKNKSLNKNETILQMVVFPIGKFIVNYVFKLGFLDGYRGLIYAITMSLHSFFVRVFYYENL